MSAAARFKVDAPFSFPGAAKLLLAPPSSVPLCDGPWGESRDDEVSARARDWQLISVAFVVGSLMHPGLCLALLYDGNEALIAATCMFGMHVWLGCCCFSETICADLMRSRSWADDGADVSNLGMAEWVGRASREPLVNGVFIIIALRPRIPVEE
jgi:hypothetical protein